MGKPAVLFLERDPTVIEMAQRCLVEEVELHVVNSVDLALRVATRRPIAVAVLEAAMAGAMPSELVGKLRTQCPGLRVVFLADPGYDLDRRYAQLGSQLRKPLNDERLLETVMSALRLRSMSANVELMRSSSGTYRPLRAPPPSAPFSAPIGAARGAPPARGSGAGSAGPRYVIDDDETEDMPRESARPITSRPSLRTESARHLPPTGSKGTVPPGPPSSSGAPSGVPSSSTPRDDPARQR